MGAAGILVIEAMLCGSVVLLLFGILALRMWRYRSLSAETCSVESFSLVHYEPMARLLSREDLRFLAAQRGCRPHIVAKLRRDRRRIFHMYLHELAGEFQALHATARKMAATCPEEHSALIRSLMRQQVTFWMAILGIETRLLLPRAGGLEIRGLIASVEALRLNLARVAA
jgi:hypothetical protein